MQPTPKHGLTRRRRQRVQGGWAPSQTQKQDDFHLTEYSRYERAFTSKSKSSDKPSTQDGEHHMSPHSKQHVHTWRLPLGEEDQPQSPLSVFCRAQNNLTAEVPRNFSWVEPGLLCGLGFPERPQHIQYLVENGVSILVNLTQDRSPPTDLFPDLKVVRIAVKDFGPPLLDQVLEFLDIVHQAKQSHKAVAVHCNMGKGRTGTLLACFLVSHHNMAVTNALRKIRKLRPGSVQTAKQEALVDHFEEHHRTKTLGAGVT